MRLTGSGRNQEKARKNSKEQRGSWKEGDGRKEGARGEYKTKPLALVAARGFGAIVDSGLLSHMTLCSIIGDGELNFRVRNGIGCTLSSMAINEICQNIN